MMLTLEQAKKINDENVTEEHLRLHAGNVAACMEALAKYYGQDPDHWAAVGYLHDYDYEKHPEEHLQFTEEPLREKGVPEEDIRAILSHGYTIVNDVEPKTEMEKCLFTCDELSGIIQACARMRPNGITDLTISSFMKKYKNRKFAAGCNRDIIASGCAMLGKDVKEIAQICISGMQAHAAELQLLGTGEQA
ncbi:MAG: HD domain-containing protein [Lachnospiraceae bacterium]